MQVLWDMVYKALNKNRLLLLLLFQHIHVHQSLDPTSFCISFNIAVILHCISTAVHLRDVRNLRSRAVCTRDGSLRMDPYHDRWGNTTGTNSNISKSHKPSVKPFGIYAHHTVLKGLFLIAFHIYFHSVSLLVYYLIFNIQKVASP